jgi:Ca2+-binding RTX toxin-like protein
LFSKEKGALVVRARLRVPFIVLVSSILLLGVAAPALAEYFVGTRGDDDLVGRNEADEMYGLRGDDEIRGKDGADYIEGGAGWDDLFGESGRDDIYGGSGLDRVFGGPNGDFINVADDRPDDRVDCGGGNDEAVVDQGDDIIGGSCEVVRGILLSS